MGVKRFDVYLVALDPAVGSEIRKTRPCVVISPDELNSLVRTVIVAPLTSKGQPYPTRVVCRFGGLPGQIALDHMRGVDTSRLLRRLGRLEAATAAELLQCLAALFAP